METVKVINEVVENNKVVEYEIIRVCTSCGSSTNKFKVKGKKCIKCYSKTNNEKFKKKEYFKQYYQDHKPPPKTPEVPPKDEPNYDIFPAV